MARDPDYWKTLEERKARGDLRAYGLFDWLYILFLVNVAQLLLGLTLLFVGWMVSLLFLGGVLGLGALGMATATRPPTELEVAAPVDAEPQVPVALPDSAVCENLCKEVQLYWHRVEGDTCVCLDVHNRVSKKIALP